MAFCFWLPAWRMAAIIASFDHDWFFANLIDGKVKDLPLSKQHIEVLDKLEILL